MLEAANCAGRGLSAIATTASPEQASTRTAPLLPSATLPGSASCAASPYTARHSAQQHAARLVRRRVQVLIHCLDGFPDDMFPNVEGIDHLSMTRSTRPGQGGAMPGDCMQYAVACNRAASLAAQLPQSAHIPRDAQTPGQSDGRCTTSGRSSRGCFLRQLCQLPATPHTACVTNIMLG